MDAPNAYREFSPQLGGSAGYAWLVEIRNRLTVAVEVFDRQGQLPLPAQSTELSQRLRRWLTDSPVDAINAAAEQAHQTREAVFVDAEGLRIGVIALQKKSGAALFAAEAAGQRPAEGRRHYLRALLTWLARDEGIPGSGGAASVQDWRELSGLEQLLAQAASAGVEQEVVRTFVEAMAVWHDVDTRGYVADLNNRLTLDVALPRARKSAAPGTLPTNVPVWNDAASMTERDAAAWGEDGQHHAVVMKLDAEGITPRAVAFIADLQPYEEVRLSVYVDLLRRALQSAANIESSRLIWAMTQRLVAAPEASEDSLVAAAKEVSHSAICSVALTVRRADGVNVVTIELDGEPPGDASSRSESLNFPIALAPAFSGSLTLWRPPGHPFTQREQRIGEVARSVFASWLSAALRGGYLYRDRRMQPGNLDDLVSPGLDDAGNQRSELSVVVFRPILEGDQADHRQEWVGEIRRQLRPFDVAGTLTTGEIGVLLPNTSEDLALAVTARLRRSFESNSALAGLNAASVGIASRAGGGTTGRFIVNQARERASRGTVRAK
jgi:hypothetical protein